MGGSRERRDERSMSIPARIWVLMVLGTGGGSRAAAFDGVGRGTAVNKVNCDLDGIEGLEGR